MLMQEKTSWYGTKLVMTLALPGVDLVCFSVRIRYTFAAQRSLKGGGHVKP
jgi:hypothetical protein